METDLVGNIVVREWINGLWFALGLCVVVVFGTRIVKTYCVAWLDRTSAEWRQDLGNRAALALFAYFFGETLMRGWVWTFLLFQVHGWPETWIQKEYGIALISAAISTWAALCCIYIFAASHRAWIWSAVFVACFVVFEVVVTQWVK